MTLKYRKPYINVWIPGCLFIGFRTYLIYFIWKPQVIYFLRTSFFSFFFLICTLLCIFVFFGRISLHTFINTNPPHTFSGAFHNHSCKKRKAKRKKKLKRTKYKLSFFFCITINILLYLNLYEEKRFVCLFLSIHFFLYFPFRVNNKSLILFKFRKRFFFFIIQMKQILTKKKVVKL